MGHILLKPDFHKKNLAGQSLLIIQRTSTKIGNAEEIAMQLIFCKNKTVGKTSHTFMEIY